jgi:hypothetical protein
MTTKTTGVEWKRFYKDTLAWPENWFHEDEEISVNGVFDDNADLASVPDDAVITVKGGIIYEGQYDKSGNSVEGHFKKWKKMQSHVFFVVEVHKDKASDLMKIITEAGGVVR